MYIYVQDYYPDWSYNGGQRPGDTRTYSQVDGTYTNTPNGIWDYLEVVEFVAEAVATQSARPRTTSSSRSTSPTAATGTGLGAR